MKLPYRILVLDDDEHALSGIVELLRDAGHNVTGAATYDAAKRLLAVSPFDLLVSDVEMPRMNGFELLAEVRRRTQRLPVVMLSTRGSVEDRKRAHDYADAYLRARGPQSALVKQWIDYLDTEK